MDRKRILNRVIAVCQEVFDEENLVLDETSCAADVEKWDSMAHLSIISDLEDEFEMSFTLDEITNLRNIGELVDAIIRHLGK